MSELKVFTPSDLQSAGGVLLQNTNYVAIYEKKGAALLAKASQEGVKLTAETDKAINDFLVSANTCVKTMESTRKPYTQKAQEFVKLFTEQENALKNGVLVKLQAARNASVNQYATEERERARKAQLKLDQDKQRIVLLEDAESQIRNAYVHILQQDKSELLYAFENCALDTLDSVAELLANVNPSLDKERFDSINPVISSTILEREELDRIVEKSKDGKYDKCRPHYAEELKNYADYLLSLITERRTELERGEESKTAELVRHQDSDATFQQQQLTDEISEQRASAAIADIVIDHQINELQSKSQIPNPSTIQSYSITVLKREGWAEIFKLHFAHSPEQDLGKVKLDQMKAFAEKLALSHNIKIDSDAVEYTINYKARSVRTINKNVIKTAC